MDTKLTRETRLLGLLFLLLFAVTLGAVHADLTDGLLFYYTMDDAQTSGTTILDISTNALDGTITSSNPTTGVSGYIDEAYDYDGATTGNVIPNEWQLGTSGTLAAWCKTDTTAAGARYCFANRETGATDRLYLGHSGTAFASTIGSTSQTSGTIATGTWYHLAVTWNVTTGNVRVYINGSYVAGLSTSFTYTAAGVNNNMSTGMYGVTGTNNLWNGVIDEWAGWSRTLNDTEIAELYAETNHNWIIGASNLTLTAIDSYTGSSISTFNATVLYNGTTYNYTTTSGSIITGILKDGYLVNVTVSANQYFSNTTTSHNTSSNLATGLVKWTAIYGYDLLNSTYVENFTTNYNSNTYTATGTAAYIPLYNETSEVIINATGYALAGANLTGNPYLQNHTFDLYTANTFNISVYNETSNTLLSGYNISWQIISTLETRNGTTENGTIIEELLTPGEYEIIYQRENTRPRSHYITLTNQSLENIRLYLIDEAISTSYIPLVTDQNQDACSQNIVSLMRYYIDINGYRTVAMIKTDTNGYGLFYVEPNTINYKLYFNGDCGTFTTVPQKIIASTNSFTVTSAQTILSGAEAIAGASISIDYVNATKTYVFDWQDSTNTITQGCLYVYKTHQGIRSTNYTACSSTSTGSLIYTLTGNLTNTVWDAQGIIKTASAYSTYSYTPATVSFLTSVTNWGLTGVFFSLIIILALVLLFGTTPGTIIFTTIGAFAVLATLGVIAGIGSVVIGVIILGGVMLYKIRTP